MNSPLVDVELLSPNHSGKRTHTIDRITPHCFVGQISVERGLNEFIEKTRNASCNYVIGCDSRTGLCVPEEYRSWCSSSEENDQRAITIECACDSSYPFEFKDEVFNKLINLCTDICKRYNKKKLLWIEDKNTSLNYVPKDDEMILTVHRWFANKNCPGDWLYNRMNVLATNVTNNLNYEAFNNATNYTKLYKVQVGAFAVKENALRLEAELKGLGYNTYLVEVERGDK